VEILKDGHSNLESPFKGKSSDYVYGKEIGKGAYAIVKQAIHKPTGKKYAVKIYDKYKLMDQSRKSAVKREIQILKQIDHCNIVKMFEVIDNPKQVYFI
jgi:5'-AMP-activated protein kinase catalytic alpha subunit